MVSGDLSAVTPPAAPFPKDGRRLIVYAIADRQGEVDDYIPVALEALREHADHLLVVGAGSLTPRGRTRLEPFTDELLAKGAARSAAAWHRSALAHLGERLAEFDELILTDDSWFGPIHSFGDVLARMAALPVHLWGMTDHAAEEADPHRGTPDVPAHLQTFWVAARREVFESSAWTAYWNELPDLLVHDDAHERHELRFSTEFAERGFVVDAAFHSEDFGFTNASVLGAESLLDAGCPLLSRRSFDEWPPFLDRHAVIGRWTLRAVERAGYPTAHILQHLARTVAPRDLNASASLNEVLPDVDVSYDDARPPRVVVTAHIFYDDMTDEILDRADTLPGAYDLVVTTPTAEKAASIRDIVARRAPRGDVDVRVVASNDGRDQSAFLIGCRDVLLSDRYDLVVKLHSKKTPQDGFNVGRHFKSQQFENLLSSPGYTANLLALFQREEGLGIVYPPMIHIGYPSVGRGWWSNKPGFEVLANELGIRVPLDDISPLAPYGSMFVARPEALRLLVQHDWRYDEFGGADAYQDGGLAHILERVPSYAAAELGYHTRTVACAEYMAISHTAFEFNFDELSATTPGFTYEQIRFIRRAGYVGEGRARDFLRIYLRLHHPASEARILGAFDPHRLLGRWARRLRHPGATLRNALRRGRSA